MLTFYLITSSVADTQTTGRACRLSFLILESVTEPSPNRCAQQLGLGSILGTKTVIPYKEPTLPLLCGFLLNQQLNIKTQPTPYGIGVAISGLNV